MLYLSGGWELVHEAVFWDVFIRILSDSNAEMEQILSMDDDFQGYWD